MNKKELKELENIKKIYIDDLQNCKDWDELRRVLERIAKSVNFANGIFNDR